MLRFLALLQRAVFRAFEHDLFAVAKGAAYSWIVTLFPALLVMAAVVTLTGQAEAFIREISFALGRILPPGAAQPALDLFEARQPRPTRLIVSSVAIMLLAASGMMISWMDGFRRIYGVPAEWSFWKERAVAFLLVAFTLGPMAFATVLVAFGSYIETWMIFATARELDPFILFFGAGVRWAVAALTSVAVLALIYHYGVPHGRPWHCVVPGAAVATGLWFLATLLFAWYMNHFAAYNVIYGSLGAAIALLVWMYVVSAIILIGAEFNALLFPREMAGVEAVEEPAEAAAEPAARAVTEQ
jgi:membrane protein